MKRMPAVFIVLMMIQITSKIAMSQWVQTNGPYGGWVFAIAATKTNLVLGTYPTGIYHSSNGGRTWNKSSTDLASKYGIPFVISFQVDNAKVFAGTNKGLFVSKDDGVSWSAVSSPLDWLSVDSFAKLDGDIFAASWGLYKSTDDGVTWTVTGLDSTAVTSIVAMDSCLFAGTGNGVLTSTDRGKSWTPKNNGLSNPYVSCLEVMGSDLYAGSSRYDSWQRNYVVDIDRSTDRGSTWTSVNNGIEGPLRGCGGITAFAVRDGSLFATTLGWGVFRSTDHGSSWANVDSGLTSSIVECVAASGSSLFVGSSQGVSISYDNGSTWKGTSDGISGTQVEGIFADGENIYAATWGGGIFRTSDAGQNWRAANEGLGNANTLGFARNSDRLFVGTSNGVYFSTNNGESWTFSGLGDHYIQCLAPCGTRTFAGSVPGGIFVSDDYGITWDSLRVTKSYINCFLVVDSLVLAGGNGAYRSTDSGETWATADSGFPVTSSDVYPFLYNIVAVRDSSVSSSLTLFTGGDYSGIFRSTDYGESWKSVGLADTQIRSLGAVGSKVLVGMWDKGMTFLSNNEGDSWSEKDSGLVSRNPVTCFASSGSNIFVGTEGDGVWRMPHLAQVSIGLPPTQLPTTYLLKQNYPNPFNPSTVIEFVVRSSGLVRVKVYDVLGRLVKTLVEKVEKPGDYEIRLDGTGMSSGVYFCRMQAGGYSRTIKMLLMK